MSTSGGQASTAASRPVRPAGLWYWVAGGLLVGAVICSVLGVAGLFSLGRQVKDFQRVAVPSQGEITFAQPGRYVLYLERPGGCCSVNVGSGNGASVPFPDWSMKVAVVPADGGPPVSISDWQGATESYSVAGHAGQAAMSFTIDRPGRYVLGTRDATPYSITDIAVGRGIGHGIAVPIILMLAGILVLAPAALAIGGITAFRRRRSRRSHLVAPAITWPAGALQGGVPRSKDAHGASHHSREVP
jgi:hypothetical protein